MLLSTNQEYAPNVESGPLAEEATESKGATGSTACKVIFYCKLAIAIYGEALNLIGAMAPYFCRL